MPSDKQSSWDPSERRAYCSLMNEKMHRYHSSWHTWASRRLCLFWFQVTCWQTLLVDTPFPSALDSFIWINTVRVADVFFFCWYTTSMPFDLSGVDLWPSFCTAAAASLRLHTPPWWLFSCYEHGTVWSFHTVIYHWGDKNSGFLLQFLQHQWRSVRKK